jgi:DNA-binding GntR family transcriptional regulator
VGPETGCILEGWRTQVGAAVARVGLSRDSTQKGKSMVGRPGKVQKTLPFHIRDEIQRRIIRGVYKPGQPLREQELEMQLGYSRGPIREAFRLLLQTGLVEYQAWRGFKVRQYSVRDLENLYRLRAVLEGMLVEALAEKDITPLVTDLRARLKRLGNAFRTRNLDAYFEENIGFHRAIVDYSENEALDGVLKYVFDATLPIRYRLMQEAFPNKSTFDSHEAITDSIEKRRWPVAKVLVETHTLEDLEMVRRAHLEQAEPEQAGPEQAGPAKPSMMARGQGLKRRA